MITIDRENGERRALDRRRFQGQAYDGQCRRNTSRRDITDRRSDPFWRYSWLRSLVLHQSLAG